MQRVRELDQRDPSLVTLPIPVPSVPVLSPALSPIVGGGSISGASSASSSSTSPTASPTVTTGGGTSGGSGSGSGNGNGNGGGNGNWNGGGESTTGSGSTATTIPAPASSLIALGSSSSPSASTGPFPPPPGGIPGQVNPNGGPPQNIQGTSTMQATGSKASAGAVPQNSSTYAGIGNSPSYSSTATAAASTQLSSGVIAGIVLACFFFLIGLVVVLKRRRSIARRIEHREQWWFGRNGTSRDFSAIRSSMRDSQGGGATSPHRASARSSFATNFDQGLMFRVDSPTSHPNVDHAALGAIPELPPMAEVRERTSFLFPSAGAVARRESITSIRSNGSDPHSQYLVVPNDLDLPEVSSPMSVRPFSPSESFAFPKPPLGTEEKASTSIAFGSNGHGHTAPSSTAAALIQIHSPPIFNSDLPQSIPAASHLQPPPSTSVSSLAATPNTFSNPFADPAANPEFYDLKTICRPFDPTLDDELSVSVGDKICVLNVFDDGWAFVEKQGSSSDRNESGLIPVDCLREAGQALPAFLAQKRISSYGADATQLAQVLASSKR